MLLAIAALFLATIALFVAAVWFGQRVIAPRVQRITDRTELEDDRDRDN